MYNVNAFGDEKNEKLKAFLEYVKTKSATDSFTKKIDAMVEEVKHTDKHRREFLTYQVHIDDWKEEGRLVGLQQGEHKKAVETARTAILMGMAQDVVAKLSGLPLEETEQLQKQAANV